MSLEIISKGETISASGDLRLGNLPQLLAAIHHAGRVARYPDIVVNFRSLSSIGLNTVPPLAAFLRHMLQQDKVDFDFVSPQNPQCKGRIERTGLAHYLCHRKFEKPKFDSTNPTLQQFLTTEDASRINDKIINAVIRTVNLTRGHIKALEWALDEITDNVLNHSQSKVGGFIIHAKVPNRNIIEFTVADSGIGVARSLGIKDEVEAVEKAIQEGVTRNKQTNQGNGLYGSYRLAVESQAIFAIKSYHGNFYVSADGTAHARSEQIPYKGTHVTCQIDCDMPDLLQRAFTFQGRSHVPAFDYIERLHENPEDDIVISARSICTTFGSRKSGLEARNYLINMMTCLEGNHICIDFSGVNVISSSYADEAFGKLFLTLGPITFMRTIQIINADATIMTLIDRAITLRMQTGMAESN
jgi:anti-anti-sigma regulatory factor/anti-sigma regulatory factor (Ser/Thr protein kinase)